MRDLWIFLFLLACFGIVGRIDYEEALAAANARIEDQKQSALLAPRSAAEERR